MSLRESLAATYSNEPSFRTDLEIRNLRPQSLSDHDGQWNNEDWIERTSATLTVKGRRSRFEVHDARSSHSDASVESVVLWDGVDSIEVVDSVARITAGPKLIPEFDCLPFFNLCCGATFVSSASPQSLLADYTVLESVREDDETTLKIAIDDAESPTSIATLVIEHTPGPRLVSVAYDILQQPGDPNPGEPKIRVQFTVAEWQEYGDRVLPRVAFRDGYIFHRDLHAARGVEPLVSRTVFTRHAFADLAGAPPENGQFDLDFRDGLRVHDERAGVIYTVGERRMIVDGVMYELQVPVEGDPTQDMDRLMEGARPLSNPHHANDSYDKGASNDEHSMKAVGAGAGAAIVAALTMLLFRRIWVPERGAS